MANKKIQKWEPDNFELEMTTHWSFPEHGNWATHDSKWRGNWSPYIPRNIILRYSKEMDLVLDQFDKAISCCKEKINFDYSPAKGRVYLYKGDARDLWFQSDNSVDLICTHPPYADIIKYSDGVPGDLSLLKVKDFLEAMKPVAEESYRVLKKGKFCAILMGDTRQKGCMIPMSFDVTKIFQNAGFTLKELIIKEQHNCKAKEYWKMNSVKYNFC